MLYFKPAIKRPLEQPFHKEFLQKREELEILAAEFPLIFKGEEAAIYSEFIDAYQKALFSMYQYQIIIEKMNKENKKQSRSIKEWQEIIPEEEFQKELCSAMRKLKMAYDKVIYSKVEHKIKKQLVMP